MIEIIEKINKTPKAFKTLTLTYDQRQKSRLRVTLDDGLEAGIILERGTVLRHGDFLRSKRGEFVQILAAKEKVTVVMTEDVLLFSKACYHLGNRHVPLQIENNWLSFQRDHVLEELVLNLGLEIKHKTLPFQPECGAYSNGHTHI